MEKILDRLIAKGIIEQHEREKAKTIASQRNEDVLKVLIEILPGKERDIFNQDTLDKVYRIQKEIELMDGVVKYNIYSIASRDMKYVKTATDSDGVMMMIVETFDDMLEQILKGDRDMLETYRKNIINDDEIYGTLVSRDRKGTAILATFKYEEDYLYIFNRLNEIIDQERDDTTEFHLSGRPIMLAYIHHYMSRILYIFLLALIVMVLLLYIDFGKKRAIFLPLTAGLLSVVWGMGILNLLGFEMDVLSITVPFLVLALSHGHSVQIMQRYYGPAYVHDELVDNYWIRIPHFYYNFYVYKYATSYCAACALAERISAGEPGAVPAYLSFLKGGSSKYPIDLLKAGGVDMISPEPVQDAMKLFADMLDQTEVLLDQISQ